MPTEAEIRAGNLNVIGTMRHAVKCQHVSDRAKPCDCKPVDDSKAMRAGDVLRIFAPLPPGEVEAIRLLETLPPLHMWPATPQHRED